MTHIDNTPEGLRALLARDHRELESLFQELMSALRADARDDVLRLWTAFDEGLCRHMALEEKEILPLLQRQDEREVKELSKEHDEIRKQLAELGVGVDLHEIPVQTVQGFIQRLREHARREDSLAYRWAEVNVPAAEQLKLGANLGAASALRQRLLGLGRKVKSRVAASR